MLFFKISILFYLLFSGVQASELNSIILSREYGSCQANNLHYSAMKFYKIPLNEKFESYDTFLRIILFFNQDGTLTERLTIQALLGCQTTSQGEVACSYHALKDTWLKSVYTNINEVITIQNIGEIIFTKPEDLNRGFTLHFKDDFDYHHLSGESFSGGMVSVNFDQNARNTINICK